MSNLIPREKQSAYQRWEMESFGDDAPLRETAAMSAATAAHDAQQAALQKQIDDARAQAHAEGFAAGRREGHDAGLAEGRATGLAEGRQAAEQERTHLLQIAESFGTEVAQANELIAADMLTLSLDLAKAMLKTALRVKPELVVPVVREAIHYLPTLQQPALLHLHPEDAAIVGGQMGDELTAAGWRVVEDLHMERGGCRVETATNQIDATATTRWQRLAAALGKDADWLDD
ncbi:flagellar assembly protein FliH [Oxalicibacterium flavum]|uniref:Flagellar assembly protein FliH n=1 Tax=Oxalicibacterium flavum TaxID=179467 RepID=A0A8J2XXS3_9BURK|nr:flagellar assembly protein FliH [Oxalicibacterium flavum]GGC03601.1 flagellar assembly protein FliH [Oxalicibacterium flavum]